MRRPKGAVAIHVAEGEVRKIEVRRSRTSTVVTIYDEMDWPLVTATLAAPEREKLIQALAGKGRR